MWVVIANKPFTLRLPDTIREDLKFLSVLTNRPQASIASEILKDRVNVQAKRARAIQKAKQQAMEGIFISQGAIEKWAESLGTENELPMPEPDLFSNQNK